MLTAFVRKSSPKWQLILVVINIIRKITPCSGSLAQLVEQLAFNQLVAGSNPARPTFSLDDSPADVKLSPSLC